MNHTTILISGHFERLSRIKQILNINKIPFDYVISNRPSQLAGLNNYCWYSIELSTTDYMSVQKILPS